MPAPDNPIKCTWCTQTFTTIGNLNTHFRDFLPELPAYQQRSGPPRGSPFHPSGILREHLRSHSLPVWRDQLAAKDPNKARARVLRAFSVHAWSNGDAHQALWRHRRVSLVSCQSWRRILAVILERYPDATDKPGMAKAVREIVAGAIRRTFLAVVVPPQEAVQDAIAVQEEEDEDPPARPGKRHRTNKQVVPEDHAVDGFVEHPPAHHSKRHREKQPVLREDSEDDDDVRFLYDRYTSPSDRDDSPTPGPSGTNLLGACFNTSNVNGSARDVGIKSSTNFGLKVVNVNEVSSATASSSKACATSQADEFFPLLVLSLTVFRITELVPAEIYTTWDEIKANIATLLQEPEMKIVLVGCGGDKWDGVWDAGIWEEVKEEADLTAEPVIYSVKLKLGG